MRANGHDGDQAGWQQLEMMTLASVYALLTMVVAFVVAAQVHKQFIENYARR